VRLSILTYNLEEDFSCYQQVRRAILRPCIDVANTVLVTAPMRVCAQFARVRSYQATQPPH